MQRADRTAHVPHRVRGTKTNGRGIHPPITLAVLPFSGFAMMDFSFVIEPLRAANMLAKRECYRWIIVGAEPGLVQASNGVAFSPSHVLGDDPKAHRIVICSGDDAAHVKVDEVVKWVRKLLHDGAEIGAVADGAFFLAREGFLDGHACTLHWTSQPSFIEAFPFLDVRQDLYVIDRKRFTSAGGVAILDMMLEVIGRDFDAELAAGVAEWFMHSPLRSSGDRKLMLARLRTGVRNQLVLSAIAIMEDAIKEKLGMSDLASRLNVSTDRLERGFQAEFGMSPNSYYRSLRLTHAAYLLAHSSMKVENVALACGFQNMSYFARAFRLAYGYPPRQARGQQRSGLVLKRH